ncbi:hypothetical protein ElyMa_004840100 [Elysia marginata]|uniref:Uncharacterized protein n=1 Tax=Elysia marginata TaxID=1093978 RepID=A0AAV4IM33_9GAST|nr:hypothetical protein ElyMa_004840100 [Elysia marginata]
MNNCSAEHAKGPMNCPTAKMLHDCVIQNFPTCSSDQYDQDLYYGTLGASENEVRWQCQSPEKQDQVYSSAGPGAKVLPLSGTIFSLVSVFLISTRN